MTRTYGEIIASLPMAKFYDCMDSERYTHKDPISALEFLFDDLHYPSAVTLRAEDVIRAHGAVTLTAYDPTPIDDAWVERIAASLAEALVEAYGEEYGDPEENPEDAFDSSRIAATEDFFRAAIRGGTHGLSPWRCETVGSVTLDHEDVITILREHVPEWFDPRLRLFPRWHG